VIEEDPHAGEGALRAILVGAMICGLLAIAGCSRQGSEFSPPGAPPGADR
jgi:hypothetical protein